MSLTAQSLGPTFDPLLDQAEKIFSQRRSRGDVIDRDLLGEPGWDILLYAYMLYRKGLICDFDGLIAEVNLSLQTAKRWVKLLEERALLARQENYFTITDDGAAKLTKLFKGQLREIAEAISRASGQSAREHPTTS